MKPTSSRAGGSAPRLVCGSFATIDDKWIEAPAPLVIARLEALLDDRVGQNRRPQPCV